MSEVEAKMKIFSVQTVDAPAGTKPRIYYSVDRAITYARRAFRNTTAPGEIHISSEMHEIPFRIFRKEEGGPITEEC